MYHLTLTENQTRVRVLLQQLRQARRDPRRWLRLCDVEDTLAKTNDPESFRSLLLVTTQLEDIVETSPDIVYPVWSALRLPYVITNGPGRKCTAAEMVSAPVWDSELNWMDVLGHLSKIIPAVREAVINDKPDRIAAINARMETELTPLLFEMSSVAPVLVGEVEALLGKERPQNTTPEQRDSAAVNAQQNIAETEVKTETRENEAVAKSNAASTQRTSATATNSKPSKVAKTDAKKVDDKKKSATPAEQPAAQQPKVASGNAGRRALAVGIAETEAANDQYAHQLSLPLFA